MHATKITADTFSGTQPSKVGLEVDVSGRFPFSPTDAMFCLSFRDGVLTATPVADDPEGERWICGCVVLQPGEYLELLDDSKNSVGLFRLVYVNGRASFQKV